MTTSMTAVSASTRRAQSKVIVPEATHLSTGTTVASALPLRKLMKIGHDKAQAMNSAPVVSTLGTTKPSDLFANPARIDASSGRKTMR